MDLSGLMLMDKQLNLEKPEVIIRPHLGPIGIIDRVDIPEMIKSGEVATLDALRDIRREASWHYRIRRKLSSIISPS
jgi:hypothetical protein